MRVSEQASELEHLQHGPEQNDNSNAAHLHDLLPSVLASQLLSNTGPAVPVRDQVAGLQAGLGGQHYVLAVGVGGRGPVDDLLPHSR